MHKTIFSLLLLLMAASCVKSTHLEMRGFSKAGYFFGNTVHLDVCYAPEQTEALQDAVDEIWSRFTDIHWRLSVYDPNSDLNRINHSYPNAVTVGADTWTIIKNAISYNHHSSGEFDITIYPLLELWKDAEKRDVLPTAQQIRRAQETVGTDKFELLINNQVRVLNPGTKLSIDSIADGYAADEAARILQTHGFLNFLVDTTGELYAHGHNCQGCPWRIGVKDPRHPLGSKLIDILALKDASVTTSGNYQNFYTINNRPYSHIISPRTGFPKNEIVSATVVAPNAEISDFLSTALCLIDPERGVELVNSLGEGYASMIVIENKNGELIKKTSRYYSKYLLKE